MSQPIDSQRTTAHAGNRVVGAMLSLFLGIYAAIISLGAALIQATDPMLLELTPERRDPVLEVCLAHGIAAVLFLLLFLRTRRRGVRAFVPKLLIAASPFCLILSADRVLNVFWPPPLPRPGVFQPHPRRGWTHLPGAHMAEWADVFIDSYGLRVRKRDWHRTLGDETRILLLGDSVTFAYRLPAEDGFVEIVADSLAQRDDGKKFAILNAGTTAYAPSQELDWLLHEGADLSPALVILQVSLNDITSGFHAEAGWDPSVHPEFAQMHRDPHWSAFMRLAFDWGRTRAYGKDLAAAAVATEELNLEELFDPNETQRVRSAWTRAENDWRKMAAFCRERKIPLVFLLVPVQSQILDADASVLPQEKLKAFAAEIGADCLDLLPELRRQCRSKPQECKGLYIDHAHPSRAGSLIIGRAIVSFLIERHLLDQIQNPPA
ncbi:MAG: hypothetical protein H6819_03585 [Phycisphaerales bacterium]|nr:hypothetical protein [Phycisphaerales bacterium]MCB9856279.1 hypothetical protein [Phycisphaerales bacterium]MCB9863282.1 hypothetical protein [Phycisphaerales bacterium]